MKLISSSQALVLHCKRANYILKLSLSIPLTQSPFLPCYEQFDWHTTDGEVSITWDDGDSPESDDEEEESEDEPADKDDQSEHEDEHSDEFHGQQIMEVTLTSILAKHCDLSDLLCILLRMHVFIIIFIALEPHTYVIVHT